MIYDYVINKPSLDEALEHYGVKGMKWKKRKHPKEAARQKRAAEDLNSVRNETINRQLDESGISLNRSITRGNEFLYGVRRSSVNSDRYSRLHPKKGSSVTRRPVLDTTYNKRRKKEKNKQKSKLWK